MGPRHMVVRPPAVHGREGELSPIVKTTLNYDAIKKLDCTGELTHEGFCLLDALTDWDLFRTSVLGETFGDDPLPTRISRHMAQHLPSMLEYGVVSVSRPLMTMPLFCVEKKDKTLRLILDCRFINQRCAPPPDMHLPKIHDILAYLMQNEYAAEVDARSWFYQFHLSNSVSQVFGARVGGHRGGILTDICLSRMPMGWNWAPAIGQRTTNVLAHGLGVAWVDNTIVGGKTYDEAASRCHELERRFRLVGATADFTKMVPDTTIDCLGVEVDLTAKRFRMSPRWIEKLSRDTCPRVGALRSMYERIGTLLWAAYVRQCPLARHMYVLQAMSQLAIRAAEASTWDKGCSTEIVQASCVSYA